MTAPTEITGPDDLARTVRNATDPLEAYPNYGTAASPPGDQASRPEELKQLIDDRDPTVAGLSVACGQYIAAHPMRSIAVAASVGAAAAALVIAVAGHRRSEPR